MQMNELRYRFPQVASASAVLALFLKGGLRLDDPRRATRPLRNQEQVSLVGCSFTFTFLCSESARV
jgi:hypothetical protein